MRQTRDRLSKTKISLHDSTIKDIKVQDKGVEFFIDSMWDFSDSNGITLKGSIYFEGTNPEDIKVYVTKKKFLDNQKFQMRVYSLKDFIKKNKDFRLEIITEAYNEWDIIWTGVLYKKKNWENFMIKIWTQGNMVYKIDK